MNQGQSDILSLLQQLVLNAQSAGVFASQNMAAAFSAHPAPHLQAHCQALLDAISGSAPVQAAISQLQEDIILLPEIAQIV